MGRGAVTAHRGWKPPLHMFEAKAQLIDFELREQFDPERVYKIAQSKDKRYDMTEFLLETAIADWNDGRALDMRSPAVQMYMLDVCKRAIRASKGKYEGVHAEHKKAATAPRHA